MGPLERIALLCFSLITTVSLPAQTSSVFAVTMEYSQIPGYQYFFSRIHSTTGTVDHIGELPVDAFYMGTAFINFDGNYMFVGRDSADGTFNLYEVDTLGMVLNAIPATNSAGDPTDLLCAFQSRKCPFYYGIRWDSDALHELVKIDPVTGASTVMASLLMPGQMSQSTYAMDGDDRLYFLEANGMTGVKTLYRADAATGTITATDSIYAPEHLFNLFYDCETDKVFGFHKNDGTFGMQGSEWIEIDQTGSIVHTGTFITVGGDIWISAFTTLANGDYFQKNHWEGTLRFDASNVNGPNFTPTTGTVTGGDHKLYAAPPTSCGYTYDCSDHTIGIGTTDRQQTWQLFPNPASDQVTLSLPAVALGANYQLIDLAGRTITRGRISNAVTLLETGDLATGVYHLLISDGELQRALKLVK